MKISITTNKKTIYAKIQVISIYGAETDNFALGWPMDDVRLYEWRLHIKKKVLFLLNFEFLSNRK